MDQREINGVHQALALQIWPQSGEQVFLVSMWETGTIAAVHAGQESAWLTLLGSMASMGNIGVALTSHKIVIVSENALSGGFTATTLAWNNIASMTIRCNFMAASLLIGKHDGGSLAITGDTQEIQSIYHKIDEVLTNTFPDCWS